MNQEIGSAINRGLFDQKALAHIRIMYTERNANGTITAITHQHAMAAMALVYSEVISNTGRMVVKGVIEIEENETWEWLKVHAVPLVMYMGKGTEGLQMIRDEIHAENDRVVIPCQVRWLSNPHGIGGMRQRGEISASFVVFVVKGVKVACRLANKGITAGGMGY